MNQFGSFMIVTKDNLIEMPSAFQQYVEKYFALCTLGGKERYWAFRPVHAKVESDDDRGVAPCHVLDVNQFQTGLPADTQLSDWIEEHANKIPGLFEFTNSWDES